jgi:uncharacterized protein (UPF0333 family)
MNILILADLVTFSGVGNYIRYLTTSFVERGNKVVIYAGTLAEGATEHIGSAEKKKIKNIFKKC